MHPIVGYEWFRAPFEPPLAEGCVDRLLFAGTRACRLSQLAVSFSFPRALVVHAAPSFNPLGVATIRTTARQKRGPALPSL